MSVDLLYSENEPLLVAGFFAVLLVAGEAGFRYGRRNRPSTDEHTRSHVVTVQAAVLGLLGLVLGFTFAMATARFDSRKQAVVDEANAIGTCYLRSQLLSEPERSAVANLVRRYVDVRLAASQAGAEAGAGTDTTAQVQKLLWAQAVAAAAKDPRAVPTGLFIQSLNDVIDAQGKRNAAVENHVPESILVFLGVMAILAVGIVGYGCGLGSSRALVANVALAVLIALVVLIIVDLDRPRRGLIRVSAQALIDAKQLLE